MLSSPRACACFISAGASRASARKNSTAPSCPTTTQGQPHLQGNQPDWRRNQTARPVLKEPKSPLTSASFHHDNDWPCKQPCSPTSTSTCAITSSLFTTASTPQHPRGFRPPTEDLSRYKPSSPLTAPHGGARRICSSSTSRRRHARRHLQHRAGG